MNNMVTKSSIKQSIKIHSDWINKQTHIPSIGKMAHQTAKTIKHGLELDIRWATLPSLITPMPKSYVDKLQKRMKSK